MFASSDRVSPCSARVAFSSSLRATTSDVSCCATLTSGWNVFASSPLGPLTFTVWPSIFTSTPFGMLTGRRPIRLISLSLLPDVCEDFPAQSLALGLAPGHQTGRRRDDGDPESAEDARHLRLARVDAQAGTAYAAQAGDRGGLAADVLHLQDDLTRRDLLVRRDEPLVLQDLRDLELGPARGHRHRLVARARPVGVRFALRDRTLDRRALGAARVGGRRFGRGRCCRRRLFCRHDLLNLSAPPRDTSRLAVLARRGKAAPRSCSLFSPARLRHARELAHERALAEADPAQTELAHVAARPAAHLAPVIRLHLELRRTLRLQDEALLCHLAPFNP